MPSAEMETDHSGSEASVAAVTAEECISVGWGGSVDFVAEESCFKAFSGKQKFKGLNLRIIREKLCV